MPPLTRRMPPSNPLLAQAWLGQVMEAKQVPAFLRACHAELKAVPPDAAAWGAANREVDAKICAADADVAAADAANARELPRPWLVMRTLLFAELATSWIGWRGVGPFFSELLPLERFEGLVPVERDRGGG